ncbi:MULTISPECIES: hypothetical protein [Streptomyces]|uniref:WXG100 family type VII secretion target n=2 Tax=Streptomyces TaxID=1883 RepID=A0A3R7FKS4_9ACTN|nr:MULTISPECIES: hypothetical protein [Streptomyces]KNE83553.1 hypothetical protein ADZ36_04180 [Streptomyces fradiae]OFA34105.1 hypothetical protein BEN35_31015 [Streptomyces fradiae]PQM25173.1 hypothetical protein Sfr7A_03280 [Streptomyces xinghaiensis]RKM99224.1 hypothetical protein SFRA_003280 [Streptomyces xinghaiensis]RNC75872.1 hypothetical protein DC095_001095 [Streptomyces xinghaiensis]
MTDAAGGQHGTGAGQPTGMRLNEYPADSGGPSGPLWGGPQDFGSSPAQKKAAAGAIEQHIEPDTRKAGDFADDETGSAVKAFGAKDGHGWVTSTALKKAHKTWGEQVQTLMNRLRSEKEALRNTNILFQNTDVRVGAGVRKSSSLDNY